MTLLMFPIGQCLGTHFTGTAESQVHQVRLGSEIVELTAEEFAVWALAHSLPDDSGPWERSRIVDLLTDSEITNSAVLIDHLLTRSLLAEVDLDSPADFAARHRLLPLHLGLGNTAETPTMFRSGTLELALAGMTRTLYDLWLSGHLSPNLLIACKEHDAELPAVLTALHTLLAPTAACLDLAVQEF
ncbi:hypothetical protein [Kribbella speibonae]|uniref:Uncharacterized protein n=1 Tax=Kribbella speibonae TaxID=1572660 RepID=A0ABY2AEJ5_9ACTN|nr:hypothetical protein [Kribbella speibonae]TCC28099.1 hypothetical protein E0H58_09295 [Kribbella speibonae]